MANAKKNEIIITKGRGGYSLHYDTINSCVEPKIVINTFGFYKIIYGLINMPKNIYKEGIKEIYFNEYDPDEIPKKEKEIFKGLINILERSARGEKNLEDKIEEIKKTLIKKNNKEEFLIMKGLRNKEESFNSLYKIIKE